MGFAPEAAAPEAERFTAKQGHYLAYIPGVTALWRFPARGVAESRQNPAGMAESNQRKPSDVCVIENIPAGSDPS